MAGFQVYKQGEVQPLDEGIATDIAISERKVRARASWGEKVSPGKSSQVDGLISLELISIGGAGTARGSCVSSCPSSCQVRLLAHVQQLRGLVSFRGGLAT